MDDYEQVPDDVYKGLPWADCSVAVPRRGGSPIMGKIVEAFWIEERLTYNAVLEDGDEELIDAEFIGEVVQ